MSKQSASTPRKSYHHGDLRLALISAANDLLRTSGTWSFTLREVARAAGVSHNAPYNHFADKRALLAAVATPGFEALRAALVAANSDSVVSQCDGIIALARAYVRFGVANPAMFRLMFSEELANADDLPELAQATDAAFDVLRQAMRDAVSLASQGEPATLAAWALVHGLTILILDGRVPLTKDTELDSTVGQVALTLLRGAMARLP